MLVVGGGGAESTNALNCAFYLFFSMYVTVSVFIFLNFILRHSNADSSGL